MARVGKHVHGHARHTMRWFGFSLVRDPYHESWIFPAGVSFALKQNMYWDGFCAFLPDISGLWGGGGGGPKPCKNQQIWGGRGGEGVFLLEVQYSILKSLISTCVLSYVGSR